ncbi:MAG: insulinase family protein [Deltaproteobacteria bacterium]|jgi:predicted Zn-dependent peptidase|nr:insulinase family protein [Deltaproteobacteria bacterium]MDX2496338.1 pitrilysin family protein [Desulfobacterales bacterium]MBW1747340.1 insulinase family protein [Deltaproteobacteria bacterium]MBW1826363.1 insulinase family protein [Deltaproteobacteria bacterium]MBW1967987.1 insulinase family protein [Deltaproteobacteria bacterium]
MRREIHKTTLNNGIKIVSQNMPHFHSVSMGVWVNVGAREESPEESGLSHFIEHMIFKGTQRRTAYQIAKAFDSIGGQTNAFTSAENTCYHAKVMDTHLDIMVDILSDIFLNSVFNEKEVENERAVILQEIGMMEDSPDDYIHFLSGINFWGKNSLGRSVLGNRENIRNFDSDALKGFFSRFYQPERIIISAAGNLEHNHLVDIAGPVFESIRPGNGFPDRMTSDGRCQVDVHYKDLEQVHICLGTKGMSITDPRKYEYSLLNTILGGNMSSRLFQEIREKRGFAYAVYSFISSYVDTGMFGVYAGVHPDNAFKSVELILKEIFKIKKVRIDPDELRYAKEFTKGNLMLASESNDNQMVRMAQNETHYGRYIPLEEVVNKIEAVTEDDICNLAETLFPAHRFALTLLGPVTDKDEFDDMLGPSDL